MISSRKGLLPANVYECDKDRVVRKARKGDRSSARRLCFRSKCVDKVLDWIVFPLLLFIQFGQTMYCQQRFGVLRLEWIPTMGLITSFCLASVKYREVFRAHPIRSTTLLLLPEIFTNIVLATVLVATDLMTAINTLFALTAVLLVAAVIGHVQISEYERSTLTMANASDYTLLNPEENDSSDDEWDCINVGGDTVNPIPLKR